MLLPFVQVLYFNSKLLSSLLEEIVTIYREMQLLKNGVLGLKRQQEMPESEKEYRQWQENLTVLQTYETTTLKRMGRTVPTEVSLEIEVCET